MNLSVAKYSLAISETHTPNNKYICCELGDFSSDSILSKKIKEYIYGELRFFLNDNLDHSDMVQIEKSLVEFIESIKESK